MQNTHIAIDAVYFRLYGINLSQKGKWKMKALLVSAAVITTALLTSPTFADPVSLSQQQEASVHQTVSAMLKDPASAQFGPLVAVSQSSSQILVCGTVNAKNGFGGYVGGTPFMGNLYDDGNFFVNAFGDDPASAGNIIALCRQQGAL
jgi:hypothetical protein